MSTNSLASDLSEGSSVYHSCREGDSATDTDAASFKSFSTQSISTLNSYQSALSEFSSATGFMSAREDESDLDEDCLTLQGDEFGFIQEDHLVARSDSECSTPVQSRHLTPETAPDLDEDEPDRDATPTPRNSHENLLEAVDVPLPEPDQSYERLSTSSPSCPPTPDDTRIMERSVFSTATALEQSIIEVKGPEPISDLPISEVKQPNGPSPVPEMTSPIVDVDEQFVVSAPEPLMQQPHPAPSSTMTPSVSNSKLCCWKAPLTLIAATLTIIVSQIVLRTAMTDDFKWWKLVIIRAMIQVVIAGALVFKRHIFRRNVTFSMPTNFDFNLQSNSWTYFCQVILSFVFVASSVECVKRVSSSTLSSILYLFPLVLVAMDLVKARIRPNLVLVLSSAILVTSALILTIPRAACDPETASGCQTANKTWVPPFFTADMVYGWPIDPRHQLDDAVEITGSAVVIRIVFLTLSLGSMTISLLTLNNRSQLDSYLVLLCQGIGALLYAFLDVREWQSLDYPTMTHMVYNLMIACFGIAANFCMVVLVIQSQGSKRRRSLKTTTTGEGNSLIVDSQRTSNVNSSQSSLSIVMSDMNHLPTAITILLAGQLLFNSFINFLVISRPACCGFLDYLGVLLILTLVTGASFIGLDPSTSVNQIKKFYKSQFGHQTQSNPC